MIHLKHANNITFYKYYALLKLLTLPTRPCMHIGCMHLYMAKKG